MSTIDISPSSNAPGIVKDAAASALMKDFIEGTLRRVDALISAGLPPLESTDAFYERISDDQEGRAVGVTRQREDNHGLAKAAGVDVPETNWFRDNDIGASTRTKKPRPEFERLLAYIVTGQIKRVFSYSNSRLTRRPMELELVIRMHERAGVQFVTKVSGTGDLATADGRMIARMLAAVDTAEAERIAERIARAMQARAQLGTNYPARRPFGWGRSDIPWKAQSPEERARLHPTESPLLVAAIDALMAGRVTVRSLAEQWQAAGVSTITGSPWHPTVIRQMLRNPRLAGYSVYRGEVVRDDEDVIVRGQWEPLVDVDTFDRLQALLDRRGEGRGPKSRPGARKYLLSGLAVCGGCRARMTGAWVEEKNAHRYLCAGSTPTVGKHVVTAMGRGVDEAVRDLVLARYATVKTEGTTAPEFEGNGRLTDIQKMLAELEAEYMAGNVPAARYYRMSSALDEERETLMYEREQFIHATVGPPLVPVTREMWDAEKTTDSERRAWVARLVEAVIIKPGSRQLGPKFSKDRVDIVWR